MICVILILATENTKLNVYLLTINDGLFVFELAFDSWNELSICSRYFKFIFTETVDFSFTVCLQLRF